MNAMTPDQFESALAFLDWTKSEFATRVSVSRATVSNWATGVNEIPGPVVAFLNLSVEMKKVTSRMLVLTTEWPR